ncbi:MAG: type I methionyl aminopeptidase [Candidatus Omnitrophica bacterium]|nr:type I methionyl aminopeptidase [Candidatus Omnitrophota bacterium]MDD5080756.1 type I methionyl aminopeptidase [Candidatus Omnitrophota bacterium]
MRRKLTQDDFQIMRKAGQVAAAFLDKLKDMVVPGITTKDIDTAFDTFLQNYKEMSAAFKGYMGYPASLCVSVNEEVIHGIPSVEKILKNGDLVSVDLGIKYKGLYVDTTSSYCVGDCDEKVLRIARVTKEALDKAIAIVRPGVTVGDIGSLIQDFVEQNGFSVVRRFVGHGIGEDLHLPPEVPNFGIKNDGYRLKAGDAVAIEPMVCEGTHEVSLLENDWTVITADNKLSAHYEHTIGVTEDGSIVITG